MELFKAACAQITDPTIGHEQEDPLITKILVHILAQSKFSSLHRPKNRLRLVSIAALMHHRGISRGDQKLAIEFSEGRTVLGKMIHESAERKLPVLVVQIRQQRKKGSSANSEKMGSEKIKIKIQEMCARGQDPGVDVIEDSDWLSLLQNLPSCFREYCVVSKEVKGSMADAVCECVCKAPLVSSLVMLPTNHCRLKWETYCNQAFLESLGIGRDEFKILINLLKLQGQKSLPKFKGLEGLEEAEVFHMTRQARLLLEEGRARLLRHAGFFCDVVEIVNAGTSSDNIVIVATRRGPGELLKHLSQKCSSQLQRSLEASDRHYEAMKGLERPPCIEVREGRRFVPHIHLHTHTHTRRRLRAYTQTTHTRMHTRVVHAHTHTHTHTHIHIHTGAAIH